MKKQDCRYAIVSASDVTSIASAADPLNASRLPLNVDFVPQSTLRLIPATGTMKAWQAVMLVDANDEAYFVSPRVALGLAFRNGKFTQVVEQPFPKKPLLDFLKDAPKIRVTDYVPVEVDDFTTKEIVTKDMPKFAFSIVGTEKPKVDKPKKVVSNA